MFWTLTGVVWRVAISTGIPPPLACPRWSSTDVNLTVQWLIIEAAAPALLIFISYCVLHQHPSVTEASISRSSVPRRDRHVKHSGTEDPRLACSLCVIHSCAVWFRWWKGHFSSVNSVALSFYFDQIHLSMLHLSACECDIDSQWNFSEIMNINTS